MRRFGPLFCLVVVFSAPSARVAGVDDFFAHYRFEEGGGLEITDSVSGTPHGRIDGAEDGSPVWSADVPVGVLPLTGQANTGSLDFTDLGWLHIDRLPFPLHEPGIGAPGDATIEFFVKVPGDSDHASLIWSNGVDPTASNRFNIFWNANFTGVAGSESWLEGDFVDEAGELTNVGAPEYQSFHELEVDAWHHVAITRGDMAGDPNFCPAVGGGEGGHCFEWNWWVDGTRVEAQSGKVTETVLPTTRGWLVCGRQGAMALRAQIDEVRVSGVARVFDPPVGQTQELGFLISPNGVDGGGFLRGDCDGDGVVGRNPTDAILILDFAFRGGKAPPCLAACDAEANGSVGIADALRILRFSFQGVGMPDEPFPECTSSDRQTDIDLGCVVKLDCR